ncbi:MAG TPA: LUD domain-containing protein [Salinisphaeraceae bacterium]|nr:LUD domain-containing protein [Salinisphaeraceae bacterium]
MSERDDVLAAVRANKPDLEAPAPTIPSYDTDFPHARSARSNVFIEALQAMNGEWQARKAEQSVADVLHDRLAQAAVICSNVPEVEGNRALHPDTTPADLEDVDMAVLRARFAVAETGSVCFTEKELVVNALAYLALDLVVLLDPDAIVANLHRAYQRRDYFDANYTVLHTGPSATADIQGVLVNGAQGVRSLTVVPVEA